MTSGRTGAPSTGVHRFAYVDGLRAVAVLLVIVSHGAKYTMDLHQGAWFHALYEGAHGVDLFFVISGFCLSYPVLSNPAAFDLIRFFSRRIVRIVPAYWFAFVFLLVISLLVVRSGGSLPWPTIKLPSLQEGFAQLFFLNSSTNLCGSFWTLAVEFRWYLAFPVLMFIYLRKPAIVYAIGAASLLLYRFAFPNVLDLATLPAFLLGIIAADLKLRESRICRFALPALAVALASSLALEPKGHLDYALQNQIWWQAAAFCLVLAGGNVKFLRSLLSMRLLTIIGVASYSIYLYHDPVEAWYAYSGGSSFLLAVLAGVLVGVLGWLMVERELMEPAMRDPLVSTVDRTIRLLLLRARETWLIIASGVITERLRDAAARRSVIAP